MTDHRGARRTTSKETTMPTTTYQRRTTALPAMQFTGGEASAHDVIDWVRSSEATDEIHRDHMAGSWNDTTRTLVLRIGNDDADRYARPSDWIVLDNTMLLVYPADLFDKVFIPTEPTA